MKNRFLSPSLKMLIALTLAYSLGNIHGADPDDEKTISLKTYSKDEVSQVFEKMVTKSVYDHAVREYKDVLGDPSSLDGDVHVKLTSTNKFQNKDATIQLYDILRSLLAEKSPHELPEAYVKMKAILKQKSIAALFPKPEQSSKDIALDPLQSLQAAFDKGADANFDLICFAVRKDEFHKLEQYYYPALLMAAMTDDPKIVDLFLSNGACIGDPDAKSIPNFTSNEEIKKMYEANNKLFDATTANETESALNEGAYLTTRIGNGLTILQHAAQQGNVEKVKYLIAKDKNLVNMKDFENRTALYCVLEFGAPRNESTVAIVNELLASNKQLASMPDRLNSFPLHQAAGWGHPLGVVEAIYNAYPEALMKQNTSGNTPLMSASTDFRDQDGSIFSFLLNKAPDPIALLQIADNTGTTLMTMLAIQCLSPFGDRPAKMKFALAIDKLKAHKIEAKKIVNKVYNNGSTPLHILVMISVIVDYVTTIIESGQVSAPSSQEEIAQQINVFKTNLLEVTKSLLELGADPRVKNKEGKSALTVAEANGFDDLVALFGEFTVAPELRRKRGRGRRPAFTKSPVKTTARKKQ